jgi:hypothetical protein
MKILNSTLCLLLASGTPDVFASALDGIQCSFFISGRPTLMVERSNRGQDSDGANR